MSYWINGFWLAPLKPSQLWPAVTTLADTQGPQLNPTAWSLIIEMRASLLFPIIMILLLRFGWRRGLAVAVLYHFLVLLTLAHVLYGHVAIWQIWLLALVATLLVSAVMYRAVEVPCIAAGHYLARRLNADRRRPDALRTAA